MEVPTFGTVDMLRHLHAQGQIPRDLLAAVEATLVHNYYTDLGFDRATFDLAAAMDRWEPRGAAFAFSRPSSWTDPEAAIDFVFAALARAAGDGPEHVEGWISAAATGLIRITTDAQSASSNLRSFLGQCMAKQWVSADRLPAVLRGVRAAMRERDSLVDPVEAVLANVYRRLVARHGHALAMSLLMALVALTSESDRSTASRVVLTYRG